MKWITREKVKVDRVACPWLIKNFVDPDAEFLFVPQDKVLSEAKHLDATPFDVEGAELAHHGKKCSFEAIITRHKLDGDAGLRYLARIVNGADTDNSLYNQSESEGLRAIAEGFRYLGMDDHAILQRQFPLYDALYQYCNRRAAMEDTGVVIGRGRA